MISRTCCVCKTPTWMESTRLGSHSVSSRVSEEDSPFLSAKLPRLIWTAELENLPKRRWTRSLTFSQNHLVSKFARVQFRRANLLMLLDYGIPKWFLNRQRCIKDGTYSQLYSNMVDTRLREDLERMKKVRNHRGLRHFWGLKVRGQKTKSTGRTGKTLGVTKKKWVQRCSPLPMRSLGHSTWRKPTFCSCLLQRRWNLPRGVAREGKLPKTYYIPKYRFFRVFDSISSLFAFFL